MIQTLYQQFLFYIDNGQINGDYDGEPNVIDEGYFMANENELEEDEDELEDENELEEDGSGLEEDEERLEQNAAGRYF